MIDRHQKEAVIERSTSPLKELKQPVSCSVQRVNCYFSDKVSFVLWTLFKWWSYQLVHIQVLWCSKWMSWKRTFLYAAKWYFYEFLRECSLQSLCQCGHDYCGSDISTYASTWQSLGTSCFWCQWVFHRVQWWVSLSYHRIHSATGQHQIKNPPWDNWSFTLPAINLEQSATFQSTNAR